MTFYYMSPYSKIYFKKTTGIRTVNFGSLFIFINWFRIAPYGNEWDDWLWIEKRKWQWYARYLWAREILWRVEVLDTAWTLQIVSSREWLVENSAFKALKKLSMLTHSRLEKYVVNWINWDTINGETKLERDTMLIEHEWLIKELTLDELQEREDF